MWVEWPSIIANQSVNQFIKWRRSANKDVRVCDLLHLYHKLHRFQGTGELTDIDVLDFKWVELTYSPTKDYWVEFTCLRLHQLFVGAFFVIFSTLSSDTSWKHCSAFTCSGSTAWDNVYIVHIFYYSYVYLITLHYDWGQHCNPNLIMSRCNHITYHILLVK